MGTLYFGSAQRALRVDDHILAHVKVVVTSKLRRNESFLLSWEIPAGEGSGRASAWIHPSSDLLYVFEGGRYPELDKSLLDQLAQDASSSNGMHIEASLERPFSRPGRAHLP